MIALYDDKKVEAEINCSRETHKFFIKIFKLILLNFPRCPSTLNHLINLKETSLKYEKKLFLIPIRKNYSFNTVILYEIISMDLD